MFDTPGILNLHDTKRDSYICKWMSGRLESAEGRSLHAVAHLAMARSQDSGTGILGEAQKIGQSGNRLPSFWVRIEEAGMPNKQGIKYFS